MTASVGRGQRLENSNSFTDFKAQLKKLEKLENLERKVALVSRAPFHCDEAKLKEMSSPSYFQQYPCYELNGHLEALMMRFVSNLKDDEELFKNIFHENGLPTGPLEFFFNRLSKYILLKKDTDQKKIISNLLRLISFKRIQTISQAIFPFHDFNEHLFMRVKADAMDSMLLAQYQPPKEYLNKLKTFWNICTQDLDVIFEAMEILTKKPTTTLEATALLNAYKLPFGVIDERIIILNVFRRLFLHYFTTTPSSLDPLLVYSDPNFYENVLPISNRDRILSDIFSAWDENVIPILVGETGSGKTSILIEVARRVHKRTIPGMQNEDYKAFGGSACSLANLGSNANIEKIFRKICEKKDHTILLLDEIEAFNKSQKTLLRTYFNGSPQSIRYALFTTTPKGAVEFYKDDDGSLSRRFKNIDVPNLSGKEANVLHHQALSMAANLIVESSVIERIVNLSKGKFSEAQKMLFKVIRKTLNHNITPPSQSLYDSKMTQICTATQKHRSTRLENGDTSKTASILYCLEKEKKALEDTINKEKLDIQTHGLLLEKRTQLDSKILGISQEILTKFNNYLLERNVDKSQIDPEIELKYFKKRSFQKIIHADKKEFIYYNLFLKNALYERIEEFEKEHNLTSIIKVAALKN